MPVIPFNKLVDEVRIIRKRGPKEKTPPPQKKERKSLASAETFRNRSL
jgi:hypothetical protein